MLERLTQIGH